MIFKRAALGISALALALTGTLVATPGAALAGANDNAAATVTGVTSVAAAPCPSGNFCVYTQTGGKGRMFKLYNCKTYSLHGWNGHGSWQNNNTDDASAKILDKDGKVLVSTTPPSVGRYANPDDSDYNFVPAWFVKAC